MTRPLLLDLFCGAGGAAMGYHRAGFDVIGVDIDPQPNYPFPFVQADALNPPFDLTRFAAIHASPPCQSYSTMSNRHGSAELELIDDVREMLQASGLPWVIENVTGARRSMRSPQMLHGGHFGLNVYRPRLFEARVAMDMPWATWNGCREAIPPAYTEHIGRQLIDHIGTVAA